MSVTLNSDQLRTTQNINFSASGKPKDLRNLLTGQSGKFGLLSDPRFKKQNKAKPKKRLFCHCLPWNDNPIKLNLTHCLYLTQTHKTIWSQRMTRRPRRDMNWNTWTPAVLWGRRSEERGLSKTFAGQQTKTSLNGYCWMFGISKCWELDGGIFLKN